MPDRNVTPIPGPPAPRPGPPAPAPAPQAPAPAAVRVKFGARPDDDMPLSWAEKMLTNLRDSNPKLFGKLLTEIVTGQNGNRA